METVTNSAEETKAIGEKFAAKLVGGEVLALIGDLGSGKTTFVQGLANGLGIRQRIISPTFILLRNYTISNSNNDKLNTFNHIDLYRLGNDAERELLDLGFKELSEDERTVTVVEWADKAKGVFSDKTIWIRFNALSGDSRKIEIS
jgi:tRNA threonylcarbamoyladenosine biosynthesis protein TsaE